MIRAAVGGRCDPDHRFRSLGTEPGGDCREGEHAAGLFPRTKEGVLPREDTDVAWGAPRIVVVVVAVVVARACCYGGGGGGGGSLRIRDATHPDVDSGMPPIVGG